MRSKTKKTFLTYTLRLVFFCLLFSLVVALPARAQIECESVSDSVCPPADSVRLQVYLPMEGVKCCKAEGLAVRDGIVQVAPKTIYFIKDIKTYISGIYTLSIGVVALGAVIVIMLGGFEYVWAAGNQQKISSAKSMIAGALGGLVLALLSYGLLNTINPEIKNLRITTARDVTKIERALYCEDVPLPVPPSIETKNFAEIPLNNTPLTDLDYKLEKKDTMCGKGYYIRGGAGNTCLGRVCADTELRCVNGSCQKAIIYGTYKFEAGKFIDDAIDLWGICDMKGVYSYWSALETNLDDNTTAVEYVVAGDPSKSAHCDNPLKYYLTIEVNDAGGTDDDFVLAPHPGPSDSACDMPIMLCKDNVSKVQTLASPSNICAAGTTAVLVPSKMDLKILYTSPRLWSEAQITKGSNVCNIDITKDKFPEDNIAPPTDCGLSGVVGFLWDVKDGQKEDASPYLTALLTTLESRMRVKINSISDDNLFDPPRTCTPWESGETYGSPTECQHGQNSAHYGGPDTPPRVADGSSLVPARTHTMGFSCGLDLGAISLPSWSYPCIELELNNLKNISGNPHHINYIQCEIEGSSEPKACDGTEGTINHLHMSVEGCNAK